MGKAKALQVAGTGLMGIATMRAEREEAAEAREWAAQQAHAMERLRHSNNIKVKDIEHSFLKTQAEEAKTHEMNLVKEKEKLRIAALEEERTHQAKLLKAQHEREDEAPMRALEQKEELERKELANRYSKLKKQGHIAEGESESDWVARKQAEALIADTRKDMSSADVTSLANKSLENWAKLLPDEKADLIAKANGDEALAKARYIRGDVKVVLDIYEKQQQVNPMQTESARAKAAAGEDAGFDADIKDVLTEQGEEAARADMKEDGFTSTQIETTINRIKQGLPAIPEEEYVPPISDTGDPSFMRELGDQAKRMFDQDKKILGKGFSATKRILSGL
jgi:hypothetical protein